MNTVDVYPLVCRLLKLECHKNNGTIDNFIDSLQSASSHLNKGSSIWLCLAFLMIIKMIDL